MSTPRTVTRSAPAHQVLELTELQDDEGYFASQVRWGDGSVTADRNLFGTALVLRALRHQGDDPALRAIRVRSLDLLEGAYLAAPGGACSFWTDAARPGWARAVPPDADDTAVITHELLRAGRVGQDQALRTACHVLLAHRVRQDNQVILPPWVRPGAFVTWLRRDHRANPVDLVVNVNVVALLSRLGCTHVPGYDAAVDSVVAGLDWAGDDAVRQSTLTPFYCGAEELAEALAHAVECGASGLEKAWRMVSVRHHGASSEHVSFRSAYGRATWQVPALTAARRLFEPQAHAADCVRSA